MNEKKKFASNKEPFSSLFLFFFLLFIYLLVFDSHSFLLILQSHLLSTVTVILQNNAHYFELLTPIMSVSN